MFLSPPARRKAWLSPIYAAGSPCTSPPGVDDSNYQSSLHEFGFHGLLTGVSTWQQQHLCTGRRTSALWHVTASPEAAGCLQGVYTGILRVLEVVTAAPSWPTPRCVHSTGTRVNRLCLFAKNKTSRCVRITDRKMPQEEEPPQVLCRPGRTTDHQRHKMRVENRGTVYFIGTEFNFVPFHLSIPYLQTRRDRIRRLGESRFSPTPMYSTLPRGCEPNGGSISHQLRSDASLYHLRERSESRPQHEHHTRQPIFRPCLYFYSRPTRPS